MGTEHYGTDSDDREDVVLGRVFACLADDGEPFVVSKGELGFEFFVNVPFEEYEAVEGRRVDLGTSDVHIVATVSVGISGNDTDEILMAGDHSVREGAFAVREGGIDCREDVGVAGIEFIDEEHAAVFIGLTEEGRDVVSVSVLVPEELVLARGLSYGDCVERKVEEFRNALGGSGLSRACRSYEGDVEAGSDCLEKGYEFRVFGRDVDFGMVSHFDFLNLETLEFAVDCQPYLVFKKSLNRFGIEEIKFSHLVKKKKW